MLQLLLPHSHISGLRHHKFDLFLAFIPLFRWRRRKNLYILSGNEIFLRPLPFFTIFSAMVSSSTSCISSESQPPSTQPTFHPLVLKSWILSGLDLTYSFLFPCTSITCLKSRKGPGVTLILGRRDEASLPAYCYDCKSSAIGANLSCPFLTENILVDKGRNVMIVHNEQHQSHNVCGIQTVSSSILIRKRFNEFFIQFKARFELLLWILSCLSDLASAFDFPFIYFNFNVQNILSITAVRPLRKSVRSVINYQEHKIIKKI